MPSRERTKVFLGRCLLGPELPPGLVGDDYLVAAPTGAAEQLSEHDLRHDPSAIAPDRMLLAPSGAGGRGSAATPL